VVESLPEEHLAPVRYDSSTASRILTSGGLPLCDSSTGADSLLVRLPKPAIARSQVVRDRSSCWQFADHAQALWRVMKRSRSSEWSTHAHFRSLLEADQALLSYVMHEVAGVWRLHRWRNAPKRSTHGPQSPCVTVRACVAAMRKIPTWVACLAQRSSKWLKPGLRATAQQEVRGAARSRPDIHARMCGCDVRIMATQPSWLAARRLVRFRDVHRMSAGMSLERCYLPRMPASSGCPLCD
jgi:hypothetical protein